MKLLGGAAVALLAFCASANAGDDPYAVYYTNTYVITSSKGVVTKVLAQKDGTWTSSASDGTTGHGQWAGLGNYTCISDAAMPNQAPMCAPYVAHKVGDTWTTPGMGGTTDQNTITAGR
jgi:hypothetical protein